MTTEEIEQLFIRGAEVDRRLPDTARPARLKAQALPYVHDHHDQAGWGGERYSEERQAFWDSRSTRLQTQDVSDWERCNDLILHVERERDRRCLWAWAKSKASGMPFSRWCRDVEGIHRNYGIECKDRAVSRISANIVRNALINIQEVENDTLQNDPEISDKLINIEEPRRYCQMTADAFSAYGIPELRDFSWAEKRNEARRQREAKKRAAA